MKGVLYPIVPSFIFFPSALIKIKELSLSMGRARYIAFIKGKEV